MKETIEKNVVNITIGTAITVIIGVAISVWNVADLKADLQKENYSFNTRLTVVENDIKQRKEYLYTLKSDLKDDIGKNSRKLNDIYNLLIKR